MAIEKVIDIKVNSKDAQANLEFLNSTLEEQRLILIALEKGLLEVEQIQKSTSKNQFAAQRILTVQADHLKDSIKDQKLALSTLNVERRQAVITSKELADEEGNASKIIQGLDKLTDGLATKTKKLYQGFIESAKSLKTLVAGLKGFKTAIISTGIGALVVALGLIVAYWDDIVYYINEATGKTEKLNAVINKRIEKDQFTAELLEIQKATLDAQEKSLIEINKQLKKQYELLIDDNDALLINLQTNLETEKSYNRRITLLERLKLLATSAFSRGVGYKSEFEKSTSEDSEKTAEIELSINKILLDQANLKKKIALLNKDSLNTLKKIEDTELKDLERIRKGMIDTDIEIRAERIKIVNDTYNELVKLAKKYNIDTTELEKARVTKLAEIDADSLEKIRKGQVDSIAEQRVEQLKAIEDEYNSLIRLAEITIQNEDEKQKAILKLQSASFNKRSELENQFITQDSDKEKEKRQRIQDAAKFDIQQYGSKLQQLKSLRSLELKGQDDEIQRLQDLVNQANLGTDERIAAQERLDNYLEESRQKNSDRDRDIFLLEQAMRDERTSQLAKFAGEISNIFGALSAFSSVRTIEQQQEEARLKGLIDLEEEGSEAKIQAQKNLQAYQIQAQKRSKQFALLEIVAGTAAGFINALLIAQQGGMGTGAAAPFTTPIFFATQIAAVLSAAARAKALLNTIPGGANVSTPTAPDSTNKTPKTSTQSQAPIFNIVGTTGANQIADVFASQNQSPMRAYVVANDITTAQSLQRNIIEGAGI